MTYISENFKKQSENSSNYWLNEGSGNGEEILAIIQNMDKVGISRINRNGFSEDISYLLSGKENDILFWDCHSMCISNKNGEEKISIYMDDDYKTYYSQIVAIN